MRIALLATGVAFCVLFGLATLKVIAETGFDVLSFISLVIVFMLGAGLVGAIRNPPPDD